MIHQVIFPALLELLFQVRCPVQSPGRAQMRLVGEYAGNTFAKLIANFALIGGHGDFEKLFCNAGPE